jgi:GNAT superfamily N-acetyltransferase
LANLKTLAKRVSPKENIMAKYIFKKAGVKDVEDFYKVFSYSLKTQFPEYSSRIKKFMLLQEYCPQAVKAQLKDKVIVIYLALLDKQIIGFLMGRYIVGGVGLGVWLGVAKEHQGQGVATKLLQNFQADAKKAGWHVIHLWTEKRNIEFYEKKGFVYAGKIPKFYYGVDSYLFYKPLQAPKPKNFLQIKLLN